MIILVISTISLLLMVIFMAVRIRSMKNIVDRHVKRESAFDNEKSEHDRSEKLKVKLEFAIKSLSALLWEYDIENDILWSNDPKSILANGMSFDLFLKAHHKNDEQLIRNGFRKLRDGEIENLKLELLMREDGDNYRWVEVHGMVSDRQADGTASKIVGLRRDIQSEVESREELMKQRQQLEEYAIKADLAMRSGDIIVWEYDFKTETFSSPDKNSFICNGISKENFYKMVDPQDIAILETGMEELLTEREWFQCQSRFNIPNKGLRWIDITATVLSRDPSGQASVITGVRRDITKEIEMTSELIDLRNKAEESNIRKSAFLANMSHEIRTPLNAIVGFSSLITTCEDREEAGEYLKIIETNNELLLQLINDILDISKIEAGKLEFHMSEINVNETMQQLEQMFAMRAKSGVKVVFDAPHTDLKYLISDPNRLTQVITNFLSNAVKFTFEGEIHMGYKSLEQGTYFYVRDSGKGISDENIPYVFDRFAKFDSLVKGTGLGLAIGKSIAERLGGEIGVESELGKGSLFWFTVAESLHDGRQESEEPDVAPITDKDVSGYKILIAEDSPSNYKLYEHSLKDYELIHAWDGKQALALFAEHNPALVLMDIRMPVMNGYEATMAIRDISPNVPIIAVTASVLGDEMQQILDYGFTGFLAKPVNIKELRELIYVNLVK